MDAWLDLKTVVWLFPVVFMFHDLEEIITVEGWGRRNRHKLNRLLSARLATNFEKILNMTTAQFAVAVTVILVFVSSSTFLAANEGSYLFFVTCITVAFLHVFTHAGQSLLLGAYTPGVVTAVTIVLPYSAYVYHRLFDSGLIGWQTVGLCVLLSLLAVPVVITALAAGRHMVPSGSGDRCTGKETGLVN
ncbi:hypothetical protein EFBL_0137 [Effusibacillus lacus]|uniref:HXXEE domain-containing protein n=1 Tax=Effusibacillus lacus TaxID=1348429 RepID=A0A292YGM2_9BACL|nr:hypothetical protein EFBL_0137 [Effusibacillus lacus]